MVLEGEGGVLSFELDLHLICNKTLCTFTQKALDANVKTNYLLS